MRFKVLLGVLIGAFSIYNVITLYDSFLPQSSFLSLANLALAGDETGSGTGSGEGGTGSGSEYPTPPSILTCTQRGGFEYPKQLLVLQSCVKEVKVSVGGTIKWEKIKGSQCVCSDKTNGFAGQLGCNKTWETSCV